VLHLVSGHEGDLAFTEFVEGAVMGNLLAKLICGGESEEVGVASERWVRLREGDVRLELQDMGECLFGWDGQPIVEVAEDERKIAEEARFCGTSVGRGGL
jgi:hypothetical protein